MDTKLEPNFGSFAGLRVLIVEDEALIAEELWDRLTRLGIEVVAIADTGERAIQAAEQHQPGLILMDIRLKGSMDGIQAADAIVRRVPAPLVFLTAHSDKDTLARAKDVEPFGYVLKPFNERDLVVAIEMALHRHALDLRLKGSERDRTATLASIVDGVIAADPDGRVTFMNRTAEALTGWRLSEAKGNSVSDVFELINEQTRAAVENPALEAMRRNEVIATRGPVLLLTRNREAIPVEESAAPITDDDGKPRGVVVAFRDIRSRRQADDAAKTADEHAHQQDKMESIRQLSGGVAHNFNNLLTVINGFSELLLEGEGLDKSARSSLAQIREAGLRASRLTRRLSAFARKQILQPTNLDIGQLITTISRPLSRLFPGEIALSTACAPDLWPIYADPAQIEQVVMNLAANSFAAMPRGGLLKIRAENVELTKEMLSAWPDVPPGRYVLLEVSDTGIGMDKTILSRVFEPFFAGSGLGKENGMGLAVVYGIVIQSGGVIELSSNLGKGTTVKLYFPALAEGTPPVFNSPA